MSEERTTASYVRTKRPELTVNLPHSIVPNIAIIKRTKRATSKTLRVRIFNTRTSAVTRAA